MKLGREILIEPLDAGDLVGFAQASALDATVFPHPSLPFVAGGSPAIWIARHAMSSGYANDTCVVGFAATQAEGGALDIVGLAVDPAWRKQGLGTNLIRTVVHAAMGRRHRYVTLRVSTANAEAIRLYEREAFARVRRIPSYYSSPRFEDGGAAWVMRRAL